MTNEERKAKFAAIEATITKPSNDNFWCDMRLQVPPTDTHIFLMIIVQSDLRVTVGMWNAQLEQFLTHIGSYYPSAVRYWAEIPKLV